MTNKIIFSIKPKMFTVYDFHMDFQFWSKKVLPRDFQMGLTLPWLWEGCDWCGMDPKNWKMYFWDLYRSGHVWLSVVLIYPNLSAFWTHPTVYLLSTWCLRNYSNYTHLASQSCPKLTWYSPSCPLFTLQLNLGQPPHPLLTCIYPIILNAWLASPITP